MALTSRSPIPTKSFPHTQSLVPHQPTFSLLPTNPKPRSIQPISAVHAAEPTKNPTVADKVSKATAASPAATKTVSTKWSVDSWKSKNALQLPEYPDQAELESVLRTIDAFPPIVFAGEARSLEERLGEAAMGNAFLLQGGDCAESFKEFNANNIRDTFRILLQMGVVLMFGGQMPVIKVNIHLIFTCFCKLLSALYLA